MKRILIISILYYLVIYNAYSMPDIYTIKSEQDTLDFLSADTCSESIEVYRIYNPVQSKVNLNVKVDNSNYTIYLPRPDTEMKNFTVQSINVFERGFILKVNWGGGKNFYGSDFTFIVKDDKLLLTQVINRNFDEHLSNPVISTKNFKSGIDADNLEILRYIY